MNQLVQDQLTGKRQKQGGMQQNPLREKEKTRS
jgi:hypothetical protein